MRIIYWNKLKSGKNFVFNKIFFKNHKTYFLYILCKLRMTLLLTFNAEKSIQKCDNDGFDAYFLKEKIEGVGKTNDKRHRFIEKWTIGSMKI